jgi:hypothetical protein
LVRVTSLPVVLQIAASRSPPGWAGADWAAHGQLRRRHARTVRLDQPALPDADLDPFVARLARRIASFPAEAVLSANRVLNELTLPGAEAIRADARRFRQLVASDTARARIAALFTQGLQTRGQLELELGDASEPSDRKDQNPRPGR